MNATIYDEVKVTISLGDLLMINSAANSFQIADEKSKALEKKIAELLKECERQANDIDKLRFRISDAKDKLDAWEKAEKVEKPIADALAYLAYIDEHNTPFEDADVDTACAVIRSLLAKKSAAPVETPAAPAMEDAI